MSSRLCSNCAFWQSTSASNSFGECHRFPAVPITYVDDEGDTALVGDKWPLVSATQWCGEHRGRQ